MAIASGTIFCCSLFSRYFAPAARPCRSNLSRPGAAARALRSDSAWMGTDDVGRDIYSRVLYGGRVSILIGVVVMLVIGDYWHASRDDFRLLQLIRYRDHAHDGRSDGVSEYFAGDRDHGRARTGRGQCLPGAGDCLHPGDRPVDAKLNAWFEAAAVCGVGTVDRIARPRHSAALYLSERALAADRAMHLRDRLRNHCGSIAFLSWRGRESRNSHLGKYAAGRAAVDPARLVAGDFPGDGAGVAGAFPNLLGDALRDALDPRGRDR